MLIIVDSIVAAVLLLAAIAVYFAGNAHVVNGVDYTRVDACLVNRRAGRRLLLLACGAIACAATAWMYRDLAMPMFFAQILLVFIGCVFITAGNSKLDRVGTKTRM
jgi:hypothetical protein